VPLRILFAMTTRPEDMVTTAPVEEVVSAIEAFDLDALWGEVASDLRIALPRRRPLPPGAENLPTREYPPGIEANLGLDIGPAMLFVSHEQLKGWDTTVEQAFEQALANVTKRLQERKQFALLHERIAGHPSSAFQSREGWASSLLLMPDQLARTFGQRNGIVLAPMRDLLIMMPLDTDPNLAYALLDEFAASDMNALDLPIFSLIDGCLTTTLAESQDPRGGQRIN
jgi:hypothetical protein